MTEKSRMNECVGRSPRYSVWSSARGCCIRFGRRGEQIRKVEIEVGVWDFRGREEEEQRADVGDQGGDRDGEVC